MTLKRFEQLYTNARLLIGAPSVDEEIVHALYHALKNRYGGKIGSKDIADAFDACTLAGARLLLSNMNRTLEPLVANRREQAQERMKKEHEKAQGDLRKNGIPEEAKDALDKLFGKNWKGVDDGNKSNAGHSEKT